MADEEEFDYALVIDGVRHGVNVEDLELWEVEIIEASANCALDDIDWNRASTLRALAYILLHRANPEFTMDGARALKLGRLRSVDDEPELEPAAPPVTKRPTRAAKADKLAA